LLDYAHASFTRMALLIVDHGSLRSEANDVLPILVEMLQKQSVFQIVMHAHMELAEPTIDEGFDACVAAGAEVVIVHPYFLSPGRHSTLDIPKMVAEAAARHPGVSYCVTEPLGPHPKICEVILERVMESVGSIEWTKD
jgi:sirohydrochlorin ferrochelatase